MKNNLYDKIKGALYGVAIGDALGAPLEFMDANSINARYGMVTEMIGGGWLNVKPGEITDDTQMTIAVAKGIIENPDDPVPAIGKHFINWLCGGPKDVGSTCSHSIRYAMANETGIGQTIPKEIWLQASRKAHLALGGRTAGNGALMRTIYPALYYKPGKQQMKATREIAMMTHWDEQSTKACLQYVQEVWLLVNGYDGPVGIYNERETRKPTGYVVDSYFVASEAMEKTDNFEAALVWAVNQGGDADTIGAITGGLAGAKYGYNSIPSRWLDALDPEIRKQLDYLTDMAMKEREE